MLHPEAPAIIRAFLTLHIAAGTIALFIVPLVMVASKGGLLHRRLGLVFVYGMFTLSATALVVAPYFRSYFLLFIAVFSAYLTFLGWRALARKHPEREPAGAADWTGAILALAAGAALVAIGIVAHDSFSFVLCGLGGICFGSGARSIYQFLRPPTDPAAWLFAHLGSMLAAYISTVTGFSVNNFHFLNPVWIRWAWPTVIGTCVITFYIARYKAKFARGARVEQLVNLRERADAPTMVEMPSMAPQSATAAVLLNDGI